MGYITQKPKTCITCNKPKRIFSKGRCQTCTPKTPLKRTQLKKKSYTINRESKSRAKENRIYIVENKIFLKENPICQANIKDTCTKTATQVHHKKGRIAKLLLDKKYWLPGCDPCHKWIELHPIEAKELGLSDYRLSK